MDEKLSAKPQVLKLGELWKLFLIQLLNRKLCFCDPVARDDNKFLDSGRLDIFSS